jgi:hypothetical protein
LRWIRFQLVFQSRELCDNRTKKSAQVSENCRFVVTPDKTVCCINKDEERTKKSFPSYLNSIKRRGKQEILSRNKFRSLLHHHKTLIFHPPSLSDQSVAFYEIHKWTFCNASFGGEEEESERLIDLVWRLGVSIHEQKNQQRRENENLDNLSLSSRRTGRNQRAGN